jgi:hypothetical protein
MKIVILISTLLLMSLSTSQVDEEFQTCIKGGGSVKSCRTQIRKSVRHEKEKVVQDYKDEVIQGNRKILLKQIDEANNVHDYIVYDPSTGVQIDLRNLGGLDRRRVRCLSKGGTWRSGECSGRLDDVRYLQRDKSIKSYIRAVVDNATEDEQVWKSVNHQLNQKEQLRKQKISMRKWKRKVAKLYKVSVKELEYYMQKNPQLFYQGITQVQQQEAMKKQRDQNLLEHAKSKDPSIGQSIKKPMTQQQIPYGQYSGQNQYPQQSQYPQ